MCVLLLLLPSPQNNTKMGAVLGRLWPQKSAEFAVDPSLDEADQNTGLTTRQKKVILENWRVVQQNIVQNGVDFFIEFFKAHPTYQKQFKSFADVPMEDLGSNQKVRAHASGVMYAISSLVDTMDDVGCLKELLLSTGRRHGARNTTMGEFENLPVVFVNFLQMKLGSSFTPFARKAWEDVFKVMNSIIKEGMNEKPKE